MIILNSLRQQYALLARSYPQRNPLKPKIRRCYSAQALPHYHHFHQNGVPDVLSKEAFNQAWTEYQDLLVSTVEKKIAGTTNAGSPIINIVYKTARDANQASLFNHASMAHNNALFFGSLCPHTTEIPETLAEHIIGSFSSIDSFRETFIATATAMFGPGFVWLVKQNSGSTIAGQNLAILNTYIAGSPYPRAHFRTQTIDMNTETTNISNRMSKAEAAKFSLEAGRFGVYSMSNTELAPGGVEMEVLLGISTWEHVWMLDYGVGGKRRYLEALWKRIDWNVVDKRAQWGIKPNQGHFWR